MDNAWQMKCTPTLLSSSSSSSVAPSVQVQRQDSRDQMEMDLAYYMRDHDVWGERSVTPAMTQAAPFSNIPNLVSYSSHHPEIESSFHAQIPGIPSPLPSDSKHSSNMKLFDGEKYPTYHRGAIVYASTSKDMKEPSLQETGNHGQSPRAEMHPFFPSRVLAGANKQTGITLGDELNAVREFVTNARSRSNASRNEGCLGPLGSSNYSTSHGTNSGTLHKVHSKVASNVSCRPSTVLNGSPRVFCMDKCGNLLLSNTGLLGVVCYCHGQNMSIAKFCEHSMVCSVVQHSRLSDVNPGVAVRMDSGESIAQWRRLYFQKFGIRAMEDDRGWDWPEAFLSTAGATKCNTGVTAGAHYSDLSDLHLVASKSPLNKVSARIHHSGQKHINNVVSNDRLANVLDQESPSRRGSIVSSNSNATAVGNVQPCSFPGNMTASKVNDQGPGCWPQLSSTGSGAVITTGSPSLSAFQKLGNLGSKIQNDCNNFLDRGTLSSSIELKLGQPSQQATGTALPAFGCKIIDHQRILSPEQLNHSHRLEFSSKELECSGRYNLYKAASYISSSKGQCHVGHVDHALRRSANAVSDLECVKEKSIKNSMISKLVPISSTVLRESVQHKESDKPVNDGNQPIPWIQHYQSRMGKSEPYVIPSCPTNQGYAPQKSIIGGHGTVRPSGTAKSDFLQNAAGTVGAQDGYKDSSGRAASSFQIYAKQMENSGFFTRFSGDTCYPYGPVSHDKKFNSFHLSSVPLDNFRKDTSLGCNGAVSSIPCYGHGKMTMSQACTVGPFSEAEASIAVSNQNLVQADQGGVCRPHLPNESLRMLASRTMSASSKIGDLDASFSLNQQSKVKSSVSESRTKWATPDAVLHDGQMSGLSPNTPCNVSGHDSASVRPAGAPQMGGDREEFATLVGSSNPEDIATCTTGISSLAEVMDVIHRDSVDSVPNKQSAMGIGSKTASSEVYDRYYQEGSDRDVSGRGNLVGLPRYLDIQYDSRASSVQKVGFFGDYSKSCTPTLNKDRVPVECNGKMHGQINGNLNFQCSEWRNVPPKAKCIGELSNDTSPADMSTKSGETETQMEPAVVNKHDQVAGSIEGQDESDLSSGCSAATISELSDGMNKVGSCTVYDGDIGNSNDQVVDQPCSIDKSCSSDGMKSEKRAEYPSSTAFTQEKHMKLLPVATPHNLADHLELNDPVRVERVNYQKHCVEGYDKCPKFTKFENRLKSVKRKRRRKWMMLGKTFANSNISLSNSTSRSYSGNTLGHQLCNSKDVSVLAHPDQDSSHMHGDYSVTVSCKRKRSALSLSKKLPRRRDLQKIYDAEKSGHNRQKMEGSATFVETSEVAAVKRLKQNKFPEAPSQSWLQKPDCQAAQDTLKHSLVDCAKPCCSSETNVLKKMTKPIVCGMFGIISGQEGLVKRPRIVPLTQVLLKSTEKCIEIAKNESKPFFVRDLRGGFSGWKRKPSRDFGVASNDEKCLDNSTEKDSSTCYSEDDNSSDEEFTLDKAAANRSKRNMGNSSSCKTTSLKSKSKKVRKRSLYEFQGVADKLISLNARSMLHSTNQTRYSERYSGDSVNEEKECTCARTQGYKGRKQDGGKLYSTPSKDKGKCLVSEEQINAWFYINRQRWRMKGQLKPSGSLKLSGFNVEHDCKKEYARFKQAKLWKHLLVYKSRIHALGLYTSVFISRGTMVVEYVGEIVGPRVADRRENDYLSGGKVQYKSACYFFRIDKEHIIDATRKGGIARFVNHSCRPNCVAKIIPVKNEKKVVFFAERDIYPGEEITYDYHFNNEDEGKKIACFCRSTNCRLYLN